MLAEPALLGIASSLASSIAVCQVTLHLSQTKSLFGNALRLLLAMFVLFGARAGNATTHAYSFSDNDEYLTQANDYPRWAALMTRHAAQSIEMGACLNDVSKCPSALKGYREVVLAGRSLAPDRQVALVNRFINSRRWSVEPRRDDDWRTLEDFLQAGGDCEDYAIAKYFVLRQLGFPIEDLRVAITWDMREQDYHAVTMVNLGDSVLVLDVDGPPRRQLSNYRFLFSINESGIWDHNARKRNQNESADGKHRGAQQL